MNSGRPRQHGAALLLALLIMTLVSTLAAGMVWQQQRAVYVEAAERGRMQAGWILSGALDWARLILREDARSGGPDHLGEPWAVPLAEARLSTFLAADSDNNMDTTLEAFLSGSIVDAQARYNLNNLLDDQGKPVEDEVAALQRLADDTGAGAGVAARIAEGLAAARAGDAGDAPLAPRRVEQLTWLGIDDAAVQALRPVVTLLPRGSKLNLNTASALVMGAVVKGLDRGRAEQLVAERERTPFGSPADVTARLGEGVKLDSARVDVRSSFFEVRGRLRFEDRMLEERSLVERRGQGGSAEVVVLWRERNSGSDLP